MPNPSELQREHTVPLLPDQPPPAPGSGDVWADLIAAMQERRQVGLERYGVALQSFNGRDALVDAGQELLDLWVYLHQAQLERDALRLAYDSLAHEAHALRLENADLRKRFRETLEREFGEPMAQMAAEVERLQTLAQDAQKKCAVVITEDDGDPD